MTLGGVTERLRQVLRDLRELERDDPAGVDRVRELLLCDLRSWHPESVTPLGSLGPPTEAIRDPRTPP